MDLVGRSSSEASGPTVQDSYVFVALRPFATYLPGGKNGVIEQGASLLKLDDLRQYNEQILIRAAKNSEENDRISEAIKLYNLAGDYSTVMSCLAQALGSTIARPSPDEKARTIEKTAADIVRHYERTNRAAGKDKDAVTRLLKIREAVDAKHAGRPETALQVGFYRLPLDHADGIFLLSSAWRPRTSFR